MPLENTGEIQTGRFKPGQSGNAAGRPRGALNKTTLAMQALLNGEAEALTHKAIEMALGGDTVAMRLCLERLLPPRKDSVINIDLPAIHNLADAAQTQSVILSSVSQGEITLIEANMLSSIVDQVIRAFETQDIEKKLDELEICISRHKKK